MAHVTNSTAPGSVSLRPGETPANPLTPEVRKTIQAYLDFLDTPEGRSLMPLHMLGYSLEKIKTYSDYIERIRTVFRDSAHQLADLLPMQRSLAERIVRFTLTEYDLLASAVLDKYGKALRDELLPPYTPPTLEELKQGTTRTRHVAEFLATHPLRGC